MVNTADKVALRQLSTVVMSSIDPDIKYVVYLGIAQGIIAKLDLADNVILNQDYFTQITDELGEYVILDKGFLINQLCNIAKAHLSIKDRKICVADTCNYFEFLGISEYMSPYDFENVTKHYELFKRAYNSVVILLQAQSPVQ